MEMPEEHRLDGEEREFNYDRLGNCTYYSGENYNSEVEWEMPEEHHLAVAPGNTMDSLDTMECHR